MAGQTAMAVKVVVFNHHPHFVSGLQTPGSSADAYMSGEMSTSRSKTLLPQKPRSFSTRVSHRSRSASDATLSPSTIFISRKSSWYAAGYSK